MSSDNQHTPPIDATADRGSAYYTLMATAAERELTEDELNTANAMLSGSVDTAAGDLSQVLGMEALTNVQYVSVGPKGVTLRFTADSRHLQPAGLVNGGVFALLGETAGSIAGYIATGSTRPAVGANNNTDFFRPGRFGDTITSQARPIHLGRTTQVWEIRHTNQDDKLLARTTLRLAILGPLDPLAKQ